MNFFLKNLKSNTSLLLFILLFITPYFCPAQSYKSQVYNSVGQNMGIWQFAQIGDMLFYVSPVICPNGNGKQCISIRAVNKFGELIYDVFFDTLDLADRYAICTDDKYIYLNTTINYAQYPFTCVLLKLDRQANLLKKVEYKYEGSDYNVARSINFIDDTLAIAYSMEKMSSPQDSTYFLFFDKDLNFIRLFKYSNRPPGSTNQMSYHLYPTLDSNYITNREILYPFLGYSKQLVKFKPIGEVIWQKTFDKIDLATPGLTDGIVEMSDSTLVFNHIKTIDTTDFNINEKPVTVSKITSDGLQKIWEYVFYSYGYDYNNFLIKSQSDNVIGGGMHTIAKKEDNSWKQENLGWIYKISTDGKLLWQRKIVDVAHDPKSSYFDTALELQNGDIIAGGGLDTSYDPNNPKAFQNCWVVRLDSNGCLNAGCLDTIFITSSKSINSADDLELIIYPNPASDNITIQIPGYKEPNRIDIININGLLVKSIGFNVHLNVSDLNTGIYNILFYWKDGKVRSSRFVKID